MTIGITGVPGAGKSRLAERLTTAFDRRPKLYALDGYVEKFGTTYDVHIGPTMSYLTNFQLAMYREMEERRLRTKGSSFVTCGTIMDSLAYAGVRLNAIQNEAPSDEQKAAEFRHYHTLMLLAEMTLACYDYDLLFHLEGPDQMSEQNQMIGAAIRITLDKWGSPEVVLPHVYDFDHVVGLVENIRKEKRRR